MAITDAQLQQLQYDLQIGEDEEIFTDSEIDTHFIDSGSDYDLTVYNLCVILRTPRKFKLWIGKVSNEERTQADFALQALCEDRAKRAGAGRGKLVVGTFNLRLDEDEAE